MSKGLNKGDFSKDIMVVGNKEEERLIRLKRLYDNREIDEEEFSNEDIDELIKMYEEEIKKLKIDTERRKMNIEYILGLRVVHK